MDYIRLHFTLSDNDHDTIIAELFEVGFEGFEQEENKLIASIPAEKFVQNVELFVEQLLSTLELE